MGWLATDRVQYTLLRIQHGDLIRNKVWSVVGHRCLGCSLFRDRCAICLSFLPSGLSPVALLAAHDQLPAAPEHANQFVARQYSIPLSFG